jgi:hypothetical protein
MKRRCKSPRKRDRKEGINISYSQDWETYEGFKNWALENGYSDGLTIDRINTYKGYYPENCRWITMKEQFSNRTTNKFITWNGKTQTLTQWADELGFEVDTLKSRFLRGWETERALTEKLGEGRITAINNRKRDDKGRIL